MEQLTRRKAILSSVGIGAAALAGCVSGDGDEDGSDDGTDDDDGDNTGNQPDPDATIEHLDSGCGGPDSESVSVFDDEGVYIVAGTLPSPTPCYEAALEATGYEDGTLSLTVDAVEEELDGDCIECVGELDYEVTVEGLEDVELTSVEVTHTTGETHTVEAGEFVDGRPPRPELIDTELTTSGSEIRDETFQGGGIELGEVDDLSDAERGTIEIHGTIPTNTPHYRAVLDDVTVERTSLHVAVDVESTLEDGEVGTQPLGVVNYTVAVELRNPGLIASVNVDHPESGHGAAWESDSTSAGAGNSETDGGTDIGGGEENDSEE